MDKKTELQKLNRKIRNCKKCSLWETRTNTVPGEGSVRARIIIVGQAPGREEDLRGRPFMGRAGQFLNQLLKIAKIKREKVFITSPLKCFPPKNRKPTQKEIKACLPYLKKQIEIINPKRLVLLGGVAFSIFFPKQKLQNFRGKWTKKGSRQFFITYHPAAGLRFPEIRTCLRRDFARLGRTLIR